MAGAGSVTNMILAVYGRFSDAERRVADFILSRTEAISTLSATEIAERSDTSNATVTRFVRDVGFDSFSQFRLALAREEAERSEEPDVPSGIVPNDCEKSVLYMMRNRIDELRDTVAQLDYDSLERAIETIGHSKNVMVTGVGTSLSFAQMFAIKLSHVGVRAFSPSSTDAAMVYSQLMDRCDCAVLVSNSGRSRRLEAIAENALDASAPTILLTANPQAPLIEKVGVTVTVASRDQLLTRDFLFSHSGINFVADVMVTLLLHESDDAEVYLAMFRKSFADEKNGHAD